MKISVAEKVSQGNCKLCGGEIDPRALQFLKAPYILGVTSSPKVEDNQVSFVFASCSSCGFVQHNFPISKEMYSEIHSHAVGSIWQRHHDELSSYISCYYSSPEPRVLEIGPSVSPIARKLSNVGEVTYVDFMDEPPFELRSKESYLSGYFPHGDLDKEFDIIIASHVLEHAPDIKVFFENMVKLLSSNGKIFISIPDFKNWINSTYWNAFSLEHISYPYSEHLHMLSSAFGLKLNLKVFEGHSIFSTFEKQSFNEHNLPVKSTALKDMLAWETRINNQVSQYESLMNGDEVILAGASHLSQYLLNMSDKLAACCSKVLDNAKSKHGLRLYGTDAYVYSFDLVKSLERPLVIVPSSPYKTEMISQLKNHNMQTHILG